MGVISSEDLTRLLVIYSSDFEGGRKAISKAKSLEISLSDVEDILRLLEWSNIEDSKPEVGKRVQVRVAVSSHSSNQIITTYAIYEDGSTLEDESNYEIDRDWIRENGEYAEEIDKHYIPEGWYEVAVTSGAVAINYIDGYVKVVQWREIVE